MTGSRKRTAAATSVAADPADAARGLDRLFRTEGPRLHRYFARRIGDGDAASDMVQDAFVKMVAAQRSGLGNPAAYLQRVARNLLFDRFRRTRSGAPLELALEDCQAVAPASQEEDIAAADLLRLYEAAIEGLTEKTRIVFLLSRSEGLTYEEIREHLGISMGTVEYHMMRAIAHVDRVLEAR